MRSAALLLPAAAIALPSPAAPEKALTFNNVQGLAKMYCTPFIEGGYGWVDAVVSLKSGDGKLLIDSRTSYKIDGVPDNLKIPHLQAYRTCANCLDTLYGTMFDGEPYGLAIDIRSTPNLLSKDLGPCYKEIASAKREIPLSFQTVTLTPRYGKQ